MLYWLLFVQVLCTMWLISVIDQKSAMFQGNNVSIYIDKGVKLITTCLQIPLKLIFCHRIPDTLALQNGKKKRENPNKIGKFWKPLELNGHHTIYSTAVHNSKQEVALACQQVLRETKQLALVKNDFLTSVPLKIKYFSSLVMNS